MHPALLQFIGSLIAILAIAWLVRRLRLGESERIRDEEHACQLANEVLSGFEASDCTVDKAGFGAILRDGSGRVLVIRQHGAHFVGRQLTTHADTRLDKSNLVISTADRRFGTVTLDLGERAADWAASLRRL